MRDDERARFEEWAKLLRGIRAAMALYSNQLHAVDWTHMIAAIDAALESLPQDSPNPAALVCVGEVRENGDTFRLSCLLPAGTKVYALK